MRSILCLPVAVFFFFSHVQAQDPNYNGPAKVAVNSFYKMAADAQKAIEAGKANGHYYVAGTKIKSMESSLKKIKEKDPGYSKLAEMEETYNRLKKEAETGQAEAESRVAAGRQDLHDKIKHENLLQTVLDGTQMQVGTNNLPYIDKAMDDYKTAAEQALNLDLSKYTEKLAELKSYVDRSHTLAADRILESAQNVLKEVKNAEHFTPILKELQFRQMYWDVARKMYPGDATCEKYYKSVSDMLVKIGNPDDIKKTAAANSEAAIKNRRMMAPAVKDAAWEKVLMNGFNSKYGSTYKGTALKAVLLHDGWNIERHKISGIVTGRNRVAQLAYKGADGKCYLLPNQVFIYQAFIGNSFSNTEVIYNGYSGDEILCEHVK